MQNKSVKYKKTLNFIRTSFIFWKPNSPAMLKILTPREMYLADQATLIHQNISSIDLMERASRAFVEEFIKRYPSQNVLVFCGTGNNGGDGLAISRLLQEQGYPVRVVIVPGSGKESGDFLQNLEAARWAGIPLLYWGVDAIEVRESVVVDAIFGIGINRPLSGTALDVVNFMNALGSTIVSVDVPSGMPCGDGFTGKEAGVLAELTIALHAPKLTFFVPESAGFINEFTWVDIGLDRSTVDSFPPLYLMTEHKDVVGMYQVRESFSHKGSFGKVLLWAGQEETLGAALLFAEACHYSGAGLTTLCLPESARGALNIRCPEVMYLSEEHATQAIHQFTTLGMGPGLGERSSKLHEWLGKTNLPILLDADAINELVNRPGLLHSLPPHSILTPHMKEFDRLFGPSDTWIERLKTAVSMAQKHQLVIVLKNRYTFVVSPDRTVHINTTGNPAMSSGGMGDVLSGIITAFMAQDYPSLEAAILGVYVHGLAGDLLRKNGMAVVPASRLIQEIPFVLGGLAEEAASIKRHRK